jgi:hypothetical protein
MNKNANLQPIRHSSLPKLAECPCFEGNSGDAGPAAARGTLLNLAMRKLLAGGEIPAGVTGEDAAAVEWALTAVEEFAGGAKILIADADCKVETPGMEHVGTADAIIPDRRLLVDLKSGQVRGLPGTGGGVRPGVDGGVLCGALDVRAVVL